MNEFMKVNIKMDLQLDPGSIILSSDLSSRVVSDYNRSVDLYVGKIHRNLRLRTSSSRMDSKIIYMNPALAKKMFLTQEIKYGIKLEQNGIYIGPVVGIIAPKQGSKKRPYGSQTVFFQELMASSRKFGQICFAFYFPDINWNKKIVNGYYHDKNGWQQGKFPLPDVIYPRSKFYIGNKAESRRKLSQMGVKILNPSMVGKWEAHRLFKRNPELVPYLPETRLINSFRQVDLMAKKYRAVYLKPVNGTQGKNIIRVSKNRKSSGYCYQYHSNGSLSKGNAPNLAQLYNKLRPVMAGRSYLVQKEINLLHYEGGIVDIRVMAQKDHNGRWEVTGMASRVGKKGAITSNISSGGSARRVETVLKRNFPDSKQANQIIETIIFVTTKVAESVEKYLGNCGEMGVDIGVDKSGKVWFIEANLRPARHVFSLIGEKQTRLKSVETPLLYARYLAGF